MGGVTLQVDGLMSSRASSNEDRGLQSLEKFLERKASALDFKSKRTVKIKKVCLLPESWGCEVFGNIAISFHSN
jgi:nuclear RNA export factor